jgi:hypothetical protein
VIKKNVKSGDYEKIVNDISSRMRQRLQIILDADKIVKDIKDAGETSHRTIYNAIMNAFFGYTRKRWGEKTLMEWTSIPLFLSMFSEGKAIHIIRDPRDVPASYKQMTIETGEKYLDAVFANMHSMDSALNYIDTLPGDRYVLLKYEDFIADKKTSVKRLCNFLGVEFMEVMLDETQYKDIVGKRFEPSTHSSFPDEDGAPRDRWKKKLGQYEIEFTEAFLWRQMQALDYSLSTSAQHNMLRRFMGTLNDESLLKDRVLKYLQTGQGVESFPSDPTDPKNWGGDLVEREKGAAAAYGRK